MQLLPVKEIVFVCKRTRTLRTTPSMKEMQFKIAIYQHKPAAHQSRYKKFYSTTVLQLLGKYERWSAFSFPALRGLSKALGYMDFQQLKRPSLVFESSQNSFTLNYIDLILALRQRSITAGRYLYSDQEARLTCKCWLNTQTPQRSKKSLVVVIYVSPSKQHLTCH